MIDVAIRVANYNEAGEGHINRCLMIRKFIDSKVTWFLDTKSIKIAKNYKNDKVILENSPKKVNFLAAHIRKQKKSLVLIDSYMISNLDIMKIYAITKTCVLLDEDRKLTTDIVVCPHLLKFKICKAENFLIGPKYSPVNIPEEYRKIKKKKNIILVSMGSFDRKGVTLKIVNILKKLYDNKELNFKTVVALGSTSPIIKKLKLALIGYNNQISVQIGKNHLYELYNSSLLAIGAPGLSQSERLLMGCPTILLPQNSMQKILIENWVDNKCAISSKVSLIALRASIFKIINDKELRKKIIINGKRMVDGKGARRVAKFIVKEGLKDKNQI